MGENYRNPPEKNILKHFIFDIIFLEIQIWKAILKILKIKEVIAK